MSDDALREAMWQALLAEPKPLTVERVNALADQHLPKPKAEQWRKWFEKNGADLLEKLNGG